MAEHPELVENAFVAYLTAINPSPWNSDLSDGDHLRIYPGENDLDKSGSTISCFISGSMGEEDPPTSGNRWCEVHIELWTPVTQPSGPAEVDPNNANASKVLEIHKDNAAALQTAILDTALPDKLTSAISGFNCFGLSERTPIREQTENGWKSGYRVKIYSCPTALTP